MTERVAWREVLAAERAYVAARMRVFNADDGDEQLRSALRDRDGWGMGLRVLRNMPVDQTMDFHREIFDLATITHPQVGLAREVLGRIDAGWLSMTLPPLVTARLAAAPDWEDYRRLAELLDVLGQTALLDTVVQHAGQSTDEDVLEVADDYRRGLPPPTTTDMTPAPPP